MEDSESAGDEHHSRMAKAARHTDEESPQEAVDHMGGAHTEADAEGGQARHCAPVLSEQASRPEDSRLSGVVAKSL